MSDIRLTVGHIARHTPPRAGAQGRDAAIIDIAQDLLLRHLHQEGVLEVLAFKGGTSLRKLYAGTAGRFSLDLDFATVAVGLDPDDALTDLISAVDGVVIGPFRYGVTERRGKWTLTYGHDFGGQTGALLSKLDLTRRPGSRPCDVVGSPFRCMRSTGHQAFPNCRSSVSRRTWPRRWRVSTVRRLRATCTTSVGS